MLNDKPDAWNAADADVKGLLNIAATTSICSVNTFVEVFFPKTGFVETKTKKPSLTLKIVIATLTLRISPFLTEILTRSYQEK